jgi:hypothetical protein
MPLYDNLRLIVSAAAREAGSGYCFEFTRDSKRATLKREGKVVAAKALDGQAPRELGLAREGGRVRVLCDGQPWLEHEDPQPLAGSEVAIGGVAPSQARAESPNVLEYYFNDCPTEWHVMSGHWEVMNRWVCDPRWSFFGGRGDDLAAIWNKRRLDGDCFFDAHIGLMMFERASGYENMRDVGLTICGDGRSVASGYSAIVGAYRNTATVLYREGKPVVTATSRIALLPEQIMQRDELQSQHRGWVHLKLTREGRRVRLTVWDRLVIDYEDPHPLPGGHCALWMLDNGMLVAKARVAATRLGEPMPFLRSAAHFADRVLTNDCYDGQVRVTWQPAPDGAPALSPLPSGEGSVTNASSSPLPSGEGRVRDARTGERVGPPPPQPSGTYEITNTIGGGPFAVALRPRVFSAVERPRLSFEVKLSAAAKVDFHFSCQGTLYRVILSGPTDDTSPARTLGRFEGARADGQWHRVSFDLFAALRPLYPDDAMLMVWEPMLANLAAGDYLMAGFGGNGPRATYWLRNVALTRTPPPARISRAPAQ